MSIFKDFSTVQQYKKEFLSVFNSIAQHKNRYEVFSDFTFFMAAAYRNSIGNINKNLFSDSIEQEYLKLINNYEKQERVKFPKLLALLIQLSELQEEPKDNLGDFYMELELGNSHNGQFFTPNEISQLMAKITNQNIKEKLKTQSFITISDPACGAGSTLLATVADLMQQGVNPQRQLFVHGIDIDRTVALMCFVQLSMWHIPCEIIVGNSLSLETREVWKSPAYHLGFWDKKLQHKSKKKQSNINFILVGESY